jgi:hypothetical protein
MILADLRHRLTRDDAQLALRLVSRPDGAHAERMENALRDDGIDALLDDPRLLAALLDGRQGMHASLGLVSYVLVRHALMRAGEPDRRIADYVASIFMHFGLRHRATRLSDTDDEVYTTMAELLGAVDGPDARRTLLARAHLGNYALWLSGFFPDFIESRRWRRGGPDLEYYEEMGKRGFQLAADHRLAADYGLDALYATAALRFPVLRTALNAISDQLLFPHVNTPERIMRQVKDEARWS